jgi:hypothetical protein
MEIAGEAHEFTIFNNNYSDNAYGVCGGFPGVCRGIALRMKYRLSGYNHWESFYSESKY